MAHICTEVDVEDPHQPNFQSSWEIQKKRMKRRKRRRKEEKNIGGPAVNTRFAFRPIGGSGGGGGGGISDTCPPPFGLVGGRGPTEQ